jgi:di/tricarboxylate transporter
MTTGMLVVFAIILVAIFLFIIEPFPIEVTALLIMVTLIVLEPFTQITPQEGISGFSNPATITVLAMLIISEGVRRTGLVQLLGEWMSRLAGDSEARQRGVTILAAGPISGFVNNTPVVALMVPVVSDMGHRGQTSPSKLLIPLSYASMLGGMLTLVGTSTNLLASNVSGRLLDHPFSMFEFTQLGVVVLVVGSIYLMTLAPRLLPSTVEPRADHLSRYELKSYLTEVRVDEGSALVEMTIADAEEATDFDFEIVQLLRRGQLVRPTRDARIRPGDALVVRASREVIAQLARASDLNLSIIPPSERTSDAEDTEGALCLAEVVIPSGSAIVDRKLGYLGTHEQLAGTLLAVRRHGAVIRDRLEELELQSGDTLLLQGAKEQLEQLRGRDDVLLLEVQRPEEQRREKIPLVLLIVAAVIGIAALDIYSILVTSLAGVVVMLASGVLRPDELYESMRWDVFFLLAGIIPLGMALEQTGGAGFIGDLVAKSHLVLPTAVVLWLLYVCTGLITEVISNNASVILMLPVAIGAATQIGANPFAFVLAVTFAASMAFMGPIGYQTNLFVYGPGGYKFTDFIKVGAPLHLILSITVTAGIALFWGL